MLVYHIFLFANIKGNDEVGMVDAKTGRVINSTKAFSCASSTGNFETYYYNGVRTGNTQYYNNSYHLVDSSRQTIIKVADLHGNEYPYSSAYYQEITDNDNYWSKTEHLLGNQYYAFDVFWALQQIYDRLYSAHGINSYDDNGAQINAYINSGYGNNNAFWTPDYFSILITRDFTFVRPMISVDVVAHEFGHAIATANTNWDALVNTYSSLALDVNGFNEGLSDIWGTIMEYRIKGNTDSIWQFGEEPAYPNYSCLRNAANPTDANACTQIASTYDVASYYSNDPHIRGGVFYRWFYNLVEGDSGTNAKGNSYTVYRVGMDLAEELVVNAVFGGYLWNKTTYEQIKTAFENVAISMNNGFLLQQVQNAWYSVGVGSKPSQIGISGSSALCDSNVYSITNLPAGASVSWNITIDGDSTAAHLNINQPEANQCRVTRTDSQSTNFTATLTATIIYQNDTITVLSKEINAPAQFVSVPYTILNTQGNGGTGGMVGGYNNTDIKPNTLYFLSSLYFMGKTPSIQGSPIPGSFMFTPSGSNGYNVMVPQGGNLIAMFTDGCTSTTWSFWGHNRTYSMSISGGDGQLDIGITQNDSADSEVTGNESKMESSENLADLEWTLEAYEASSFRKVHTVDVRGSNYTLDTSSLPKGIYIIRAIIGKEILSEKITINKT